MGRSVSYLNNAEYVLYFPFESEYFENGEYDENLSQMNWDDIVTNIQYEIKARLKSYYIVNNEWDNRETRIILKNEFCIIGVSEYCGLVSLSVAVRNSDNIDSFLTYRENFGINHAKQIRNTLEKVLDNLGLKRLNRLGTFSNGEGVYKYANS